MHNIVRRIEHMGRPNCGRANDIETELGKVNLDGMDWIEYNMTQ
jgi:hypothetical protein